MHSAIPIRRPWIIEARSEIFRTDTDGAIKIKETARGLEIKTFRDSQIEKPVRCVMNKES
jgi:hypothetical protein